MMRRLALYNIGLFCFVLAFGLPRTAQAQWGEDEAPSDITKFFINAHLNGSTVSFEDNFDVRDSDSEWGIGAGFKLGYGFSSVFAMYLGLDAAIVNSEDIEDAFTLLHADLMGQFHFDAGYSSFVPYLEAGLTGRSAVLNTEGQEFRIRGLGGSAGGGFKYFFTPSLALDGNFGFTFGNFNRAKNRATRESISSDESAASARFNAGMIWYLRR